MNVAIVTDSTSDLPKGWAEAEGIEVVPLLVNLAGKTYRDRVDITPNEVIAAMKQGAKPPTTSQPSPEAFKEVYERCLQRADHVLSIHLSSKLSGTVRSAEMAALEFGGRVTIFDTTAASAGVGMMVMRAKELLDAGARLHEVEMELERIRDDHIVRFTLDTLEFLHKNGRIGGAQAFLGTLLRIKPILTIEGGQVEPVSKVRGAKKALAEMVASLENWARGKRQVRIFYMYSVDSEALAPLKMAVSKSPLPIEEGYTGELGAVISSHAGPGTYGFYAYAL